MKKLLLLSLATCIFMGAKGQTSSLNLNEKIQPKNLASNTTKSVVTPQNTESGTIIWSSDFSVPSQWAISNGASNNDNWVIRTTGPGGTFAIPAIASPTAANGFALFDSDSLCSGNQNANLTTAAPINVSNYNNVVLRFHQQYRRYFDSSLVYISTNGTTWTNVPFSNATLANDAFAGTNPNQVNLNISSLAGGQDSVWIRFNFYSVPAMGANAGCGYAWMIDDVSLIEAVDNDIALTNTTIKSRTTFDLYGTYSTNNVVGDSIYAKVAFSNNGTLAQPNTRLIVNAVNAAGSVVASQTAVYGTLNPAVNDSIEIPGIPLSALPVGEYIIRASIISDSTDATPENNNDTAYISMVVDTVSQAIRAPRRTSSLGTNSFPAFPGAEDDFRCANVLEVLATDTISGIMIKFSQASAGGLILAHIRNATNRDLTILETDLHALTVADTTSKVLWLPFLGSETDRTLAAGEYYISVSLFSNTNANHIRVLDDLSNEKFKSTSSSIIYTADDQTWYINGVAFAIDATFGASTVSVENLVNERFHVQQLYPNPAQSTATLKFDLTSSGQVDVVITDMRGRLVHSSNLGALHQGSHEHVLDLQNLNNGLYFIELRHANHAATQKLIVNR